MLDLGIERRHFHFEQPRGAHLIAMRERERTLDQINLETFHLFVEVYAVSDIRRRHFI